ncbi:hypothetical protein [Alkaliphilus sp. B6464]|uniref:hypothetical protein n=1 Tax=Alkaliphilus sp. B6464 TaxID=2731219 RepID=UPI001BAA765D|nr:hypothetical protein [Alkaliphilus sp. B6464]QUH21771.1 hypothetical protein HYG84_17700 [Alkaliphilus sp. B6464]
MNMENKKVQYYKLVKNMDTNLKPYIVLPMYDECPNMGTYHSTLGVPHPQMSDYLIYDNGDIIFSSAYRDFDYVSFTNKANLEDLLKKEIIREVSFEAYSLDIELTNSVKGICEKIDCSEFGLDYMKENKEDYSEEDIRKEQNKLIILKEQLKNLHDKRAELSKNWLKI